MAETKDTVAVPNPLDDSGPANIKPATEFDPSGAPMQTVPDVDHKHPAVDNNPREGTTVNQNKIDFNDPDLDGAEAVAKNLKDQGNKLTADDDSEKSKK